MWQAMIPMAVSAGAGLLGNIFNNPAKAANKQLDQIPGQMHDMYDPYINAGMGQLPGMQEQYGQLMNNPGQRINEIGGAYQQSPGYQFQLDQAMQAGNNAAAAGGMSGSPMHQQQSMQLASNLANQDYNQWLSNALGGYQTGLSGSSHLYDTGFSGTNELAQSIMDTLLGKASNAYSGAESMNKSIGGLVSALSGGFGF